MRLMMMVVLAFKDADGNFESEHTEKQAVLWVWLLYQPGHNNIRKCNSGSL